MADNYYKATNGDLAPGISVITVPSFVIKHVFFCNDSIGTISIQFQEGGDWFPILKDERLPFDIICSYIAIKNETEANCAYRLMVVG
jgi:hypothetical protein